MSDTQKVIIILYGVMFAVFLLWGAVDEWLIYRRWGRYIRHLWSECTPQMIVFMTILGAAWRALVATGVIIALFIAFAVMEGIFVGINRL